MQKNSVTHSYQQFSTSGEKFLCASNQGTLLFRDEIIGFGVGRREGVNAFRITARAAKWLYSFEKKLLANLLDTRVVSVFIFLLVISSFFCILWLHDVRNYRPLFAPAEINGKLTDLSTAKPRFLWPNAGRLPQRSAQHMGILAKRAASLSPGQCADCPQQMAVWVFPLLGKGCARDHSLISCTAEQCLLNLSKLFNLEQEVPVKSCGSPG